MPVQMKSLIGNKGSGKGIFSAWEVWHFKQKWPHVVRMSNLPIAGAYWYPDILKYIAIKIIRKDKNFALVEIDEAAMAGFESRGSYTADKAIDSYLIALSRKANIEITITTQLLSMIEKRAQWLSDLYILARVHHNPPSKKPAFFSYQIFNEDLKEVGKFNLSARAAEKWLYKRFDTNALPFEDELAEDFRRRFSIIQEDMTDFDELTDEFMSNIKLRTRDYDRFDEVPVIASGA